MGLFDKKTCDICGGKIGLFGNKKLSDGNMCGDCQKKLSRWFSDRRESTVAQIKEQLAYREQNAAMLQNFRPNRQLGPANEKFILIDESMGRFVILREGEDMKKNPDLFALANVRNVRMEIRETKTEVKRKDANGNSVPFSPPHYRYRYTFMMTMDYNSPYFPEVQFAVTSGGVDGGTDDEQYDGSYMGDSGMLNNVQTTFVRQMPFGSTRGLPGGYRGGGSTTMSQRDQEKYRECERAGNEIITVLTGQRQGGTVDAAAFAKSMNEALPNGGGMQPPEAVMKLEAVRAEADGNYEMAKILYQEAALFSLRQGAPDFDESFLYMWGRACSPDRTMADVQDYLDWAKRAQGWGIPAAAEHIAKAEQLLHGMQMSDPAFATQAIMAAQQAAMQQAAAQQQASPAAADTWQCGCGCTAAGKFCPACGSPRPEANSAWVCGCGCTATGKFCPECGSPRR